MGVKLGLSLCLSVYLSVIWFKESENEVVKKFLTYLQFNEEVSN